MDGEGIVLVETYGKRQAESKDRTFDGERNLSIDCYELRHLRRYLIVVGQWYPEEWSSTKKNIYHIWQVFVTFGVWAHFVYSFGCFGGQTIEQQYLRWFPISAIEGIVWESRWVISHHLGLYYFCRQRHLERFLEESSLNQALWKQTSRYLKRICLAVIVLVFIVPVSLRPAELSYSVQPGDMWKILSDTVVLALDRLITAPIFLVFVLVAYVLVRVVKGYGERIKAWPKNYKNVEGSGIRSAKLHFRKNKYLIHSVERAFQLYLSVHFFSLLITAFLGVFACAEQLQAKVTNNHSYYSASSPRYYKRIAIQPMIIRPPAIVKMVRVQSKNSNLVPNLPFQELNRKQTVNATLERQIIVKTYTEASKEKILVEVGIEAVLKILESIVLYIIPLTLMLRLQTKLRLIREAIKDSDCFEQEEKGYLFQDKATIDDMQDFVSECTGITIFGYKMPLFRAFLLSAVVPFLTALTTFLFTSIHVKQR